MHYEHMREKWVKQYNEEQLSIRQIAALEGVAPRTVNKVLRGFVILRPKSTYDQFGETWVNLYTNQGYTKQEIAHSYNTSAGVVGKILHKHGIEQVTTPSKLKYSHLSSEWAEKYVAGQSYREIGEEYGGINPETIRQYVEREGVASRTLSDSIRKYIINDHYFDGIDSKEKAYHLGLVFGVGSLISSLSSYILNVSCNKQTYPIAEKIKSALGETSEYLNEKKGEIVIRYSSEHLYRTLQGYGLGEVKDKDTFFPSIEKKYFSSFVLGFWEGRGTFVKVNSNYKYISFASSEQFLIKLKSILSEVTEEKLIKMIYNQERDCYKLHITRASGYISILDWIYSSNLNYTPERVPPYYMLP